MTTERITIVVNSDGTVTVKKDLEGIGNSAEKSSGQVDMLKGALTAFLSAATFSKFADLTSTFTDYQARVARVVDGTVSASEAMERLYDVAQNTYSSFETTAESFASNAMMMRELGYTTADTLDYMEALNTAFVISGAKGQQAEVVMNALTRSMNAGFVSGNDLNTILGNGGRVAEALAKSLGIGVSELAKFAHGGNLTSRMLQEGMVSQLQVLREEMERMPTTIKDGMTQLGNAVLFFVGSTDQAYGASIALGEALGWVAENFGIVFTALTPLMAAMTVMAVQVMGQMMVNAAGAVVAAFTNVLRLVVALNMALLANPWMLAAAAVAAVTLALVGFDGVLKGVIIAFSHLAEMWYRFKEDADGAQWAVELRVDADKAVADLKKAAGEIANSLNGTVPKLGNAIKSGGDDAAKTMNRSILDGSAQAGVNITRGGTEGGKEMEKAIVRGSREGASIIYNSVESAFATLANMFDVQKAFWEKHRAEVSKLNSETARNIAEARAINRGDSGGGGGGSYGGSSGGRASSSHWNSGGMTGRTTVGPSGEQAAAARQAQTPTETARGITVVNITDPSELPAAMNTHDGSEVLYNMIKTDRDRLAALLGGNN